MLDLSITGATVVTPSGAGQWDIGIKDGKVAALTNPGGLDQRAEKSVSGTGTIAIPGGIDPHVHTSWLVPTAAREGIRCFDAERVSLAAIHGGTTMLIDFAIWEPGLTLADTFAGKQADWGKSYTDYALHGTFKGEIPTSVLDEIPDAISAGHPTFKVWMTNTTPSRPPQKTDLGYVWAILERTGANGGLLCVHAEDDDIVMYSYKKLAEADQWGYTNIHLAHNQLSEALSFQRIIGLAEHTEAAIYLMHVSAREGVRAVRDARARNLPVYGETLQHYVSFNSDDYARPNGQIYHTYPSLKSEDDRLALWGGLMDGSLSTIATDELCTTLATKIRGETVDDVTGGHAGVEVRLGVMYTEAVIRRHLSLERFVDLTSANAAKIMGVYPQKGAIAVGSDADIALLQPSAPRAIQMSDLHETDYSVWEGWTVEAWPSLTVLRGKVVMENGKLLGAPGDGEMVRGRIAPRMLAAPGC